MNSIRWRDPRLHFLSFFVVFCTYILTSVQFGKTWDQLLSIVFWCVLFDGFFKFMFSENRFFSMSSVVSSMGIFVLVDTIHAWMYALLAFVSMGSKYLIKVRGYHVFNPNNFAIVLLAFLLPQFMAPIGGMRWGGDIFWSGIICLFGTLLGISAGRVAVSISFVIVFVVMAYFRSVISGAEFLTLSSVVLSPGLQIFIYFMITDPCTSPRNVGLQFLFGASVALLDAYLRMQENRVSVLLSLLVMTFIYAGLDLIIKDKKRLWGNG